MRSTWKASGRWTVAGVVLASVVALAAGAGPARATTPDVTKAGPATAQSPAPGAQAAGSKTVTLITGDVVRVTGAPGKESAQVVTSTGGLSTVEYRKGKDLYVLPGTAAQLVAAGKLDENLFDVSELVRDGYTGTTLPVLVTYATGDQASRAGSARQLAATSAATYLWSIKGLAATVDLTKGRAFFDSVTAPAPAPAGGPQAPLNLKAGVAKVWLDGKVHATDADVSRTAIGADKAWAAGYQGATAKVAILDTGIDSGHPDLAGQVTAARNFVPAGSPGGGDPADVTDRVGHGTHVAGLIAGTGAASGGPYTGLYTGVAPKAQLVIGKVLADDESGDDSWIIAGMQWAATQARIVSMSLGTHGVASDGTDPMSEALDNISSSTGALFVVAAGNEGISPDGNIDGGPGSCAQCIESPGAATAALTVGAITDGCEFDFTDPNKCPRDYSGDTIPYFSSTGPRLDDFAIKPEITAPGVDIPSALASGTSMGTPVAAYPNLYTYLSGTSMATPMVAGAAAVLLGQHPGWTAQQIRDALTSTATPNDGEPVYWQGAGMVNVGKAAGQSVTATGILNLGTAAYPQQPGTLLTGSITYTNAGSQPETLTLTSSWATAPDSFTPKVAQQPWSPPAGAVSLPGQVTVPAGGSQAVTLSIDASQAPFFSTYGRVIATAADGSAVQTTVGFTRAALTHRLNLTAIDQTGTPVTTSLISYGYLMDLTSGQLYQVTFSNGAGTIWGTKDNQLIAGRSYAFLGQIGTFGPGPYYRLLSWTQVAEPQITMNADQSFTFDARHAGLLSVSTRRPAIGTYGCSMISRNAPDISNPSASLFLAFTDCGSARTREGENIYTLAGGQATTGTFQLTYYTHREQAPVAITAHGLDTPLLPRYPGVRIDTYYGDQRDTDAQPRFPASASFQVADVGAGSAAEIAAAHVAGKIALLHPPISGLITGTWYEGVDMQMDGATAKAIASAGAAGILVAPPADGIWDIWYNQPDVPSIPTALLSSPEAAQLTGLLTARRTGVTVTTAWPSPYTYDLVLSPPGQGLPNGTTFRVSDDDLAQVTTRYHSTAPGQYYTVDTDPLVSGVFYSEDLPARTIRTEMYSPDATFVQYRYTETDDQDAATYLPEVSRSQGTGNYERNVGSGPWVPDGVSVVTAGSYLNATTAAGMASSAGFQFLLERFPNTTTVVCQAPACQQVPGKGDKLSGDGLYQVINDAAENSPDATASNPLSVTTHTQWTISVHLNTSQPEKIVTQPVIQATWYVEDGLDNVVPAAVPYTVRVAPSYPDGSSHGPLTARLWATYDDGKTWIQVPGTQVVQPGQPASFRLKTPALTNGFVGYRVQMSDADGNAIDQTVLRAAYTRSPA